MHVVPLFEFLFIRADANYLHRAKAEVAFVSNVQDDGFSVVSLVLYTVNRKIHWLHILLSTKTSELWVIDLWMVEMLILHSQFCHLTGFQLLSRILHFKTCRNPKEHLHGNFSECKLCYFNLLFLFEHFPLQQTWREIYRWMWTVGTCKVKSLDKRI